MKARWRGRRLPGLAVVVLLGGILAGAAPGAGARGPWLVVRDESGVELARVEVPATNELGLRYRNSIYGSLAWERFRISGGELTLVSLAAEELAVLEEYYGAFGASRSNGLWTVAVERPPATLPHRIQASALGERALLAGEVEISLWRLVADHDDTTVILSIEDGA